MSPCTITMTRMVVSSQATAITCTIARLLYRWYTRRLWWEDICAMIAAAWAFICTAGFLLFDTSLSYLSPRNQIAAWFMTLSITVVLWTARLSIFLSLIRISNPTDSSRRLALTCVASFLIMFVATMIQKIYYCAAKKCLISTSVGILQLITDVLADTPLVVAPIPLLRNMHLSKNRRILILSAFSSSILISAISISHSVFLIDEPNTLTIILGEMKVATSLFISNILVLVTFVYRICRRQGRDGIDLDASFAQTGPLHLTTIDLGQLTVGTTCSDASNVRADAESGQDALQGSRCASSSVCSEAGSGDKVECPSVRRNDHDHDHDVGLDVDGSQAGPAEGKQRGPRTCCFKCQGRHVRPLPYT